jgi:PAS domain S-box-containing protein
MTVSVSSALATSLAGDARAQPSFSWATLGGLSALFAAVWLAPPSHAFEGLASYLPLHNFAEMLSIVVSMMVFGVAWNAYSGARSGNLLILGCGFLATGLIDFAHMLSYHGMPDFVTPSSPEKAINFWLAARATAAVTLLWAALRPSRPFKSGRTRYGLLAGAIALAVLVYWVGLFHADLLPRTFIAGQGLTGAKIVAEYALIALLGAAALRFYLRARRERREGDAILFTACAISVLSELSFTLYSDVTDVFNLLGHVYKVAAYGFIYFALFAANVREPFERVLRSEEHARELAAIVEDAEDAILSVRPDGVILTWNAAAERLYGYKAGEIVGRPVGILLPPDRGKAEEDIFAAVRSGERIKHYETVRRRKDGTTVDVSLTLSPILDDAGCVLAVSKIARDITERRRAQQALLDSERRYRSLFDGVPVGLYRAQPDGTVLDVNPALLRMLGFACRKEALSLNAARVYWDPADRVRWKELMSARTTVSGFETQLRRKDGSNIWVRHSAMAKLDEAGDVVHYEGSVEDITESRRSEDAIRALNATLEERVRQRTGELEAANRELEAFAYSVSHDLRAPLRAIDGFSLALLEDSGGKLGSEGQDSLNRVRAATQRMGRLIDDLLRLSRATRGVLERVPVDLSALGREIEAELRALEPGRSVACVIDEGLNAYGDPLLLRQVLQNLLGNAWKFTGRRTGARVELGRTQACGKRAFYVRDNGAGFDMKYADKLFGVFQRLHATTEFPGNGVGLALVQRVVHRHGGKVWAEGQPGGGATFYFTLEDA